MTWTSLIELKNVKYVKIIYFKTKLSKSYIIGLFRKMFMSANPKTLVDWPKVFSS